jgi:hypothetical protein
MMHVVLEESRGLWKNIWEILLIFHELRGRELRM